MAKTTAKNAPAASAPAKALAANAAASAFLIEVGQGATPVDEGAYAARIAAVFDLGVQAPPPGGKGVPRRQIAVAFELQGATCLDVAPDTPPLMYRRFGLSWGAKAELPKLLRAILGRDPTPGETLSPLEWIGKPVTVTVEQTQRPDGSASARVASVTRCAIKALPELTAAPLLYPGAPLAELPEWAQAAVGEALHASSASAPAASTYNTDMPQ